MRNLILLILISFISVSDARSDVVSMQFFIDGNACTPVINAPSPVKTFTVTNIPCSLVGVKNGKHNITAVATDTAGNKGTSMQIEINVSNPFLPPSNLRIVKILSIKYFKFGKG